MKQKFPMELNVGKTVRNFCITNGIIIDITFFFTRAYLYLMTQLPEIDVTRVRSQLNSNPDIIDDYMNPTMGQFLYRPCVPFV